MKVVLLQSNFAKALNNVSRVVGTRTTLPVLSNVLITASKGKIRISATDLEVCVTSQTVGKIEEEGDITLPARMLSDFILSNKDDSIEITTKDSIATLKSERFEATIHGIPAEEFPSVPEPPKEVFVSLPRVALIEALKKVNVSAANDDTRPVLSGVSLIFSGKNLVLAATDSFRLAEKKMKLKEDLAETKLIIPTRTMNEVLRLLSSEAGEEVFLFSTPNQISFKIGDVVVVSRLIEGNFPNYSQIIPSEFKSEVSVNSSEFTSAVKLAALFAKGTANNNVKLILKGKELTVASTATQAGSAKSKMAVESKGEDLEVAFNARFILDLMNVISDDNLQIKFNGTSAAGIFGSPKDKEYIYLIMPLKVEE